MKLFGGPWIVVTGAAGFIGSCLVRHLNDLGIYNLILVDNLGTSEKWKNLVGKRFLEIIHKDQLFNWLKGRESDIQAFIHLGACSSTIETNGNYLLENNTRYSMRLAEYALTHGHRFIYASSAATYGDGTLGFSDDHTLLEQFQPLNMYGYSKHLFDLWLKHHQVLDRVVGLKYFNVFGPNEFHKGRMASALLRMVPDAMEKGSIRLFKSSEPSRFKDGDQVRDFIYVKDAVRMTAQFLTNDAAGIYNIGTGAEGTWNEMARGVIQTMTHPVQIDYIEMPPDLIGKYQNYTCADMSKSKKKGLEMPKFALKEAVGDYVRNYLIPKTYW